MASKTLARRCDAAFKGSKQSFKVRFESGRAKIEGSSIDYRLTASEWKGIIERSRRALPDGNPYFAVASKLNMYEGNYRNSDAFGRLDRYMYDFKVVSDDVLELSIRMKFDGG